MALKRFPNDIWAKSTLIFVASKAKNISTESYSEVIEYRKQLLEQFPKDSLLKCFDEKHTTAKEFLSIMPSKEALGAARFIKTDSHELKQMIDFYGDLVSPIASMQSFCIVQMERKKDSKDSNPSMLYIAVCTIILFFLCMWMLGSVLEKIL